MRAPSRWRHSCAQNECSLHQLSPYIGKLKSCIAGDLVRQYTKLGNLVIDPFAGAGTILLEAQLQGRKAFGADISPYARILSHAKLHPPKTLSDALAAADGVLAQAESLPNPDLRSVPSWVRRFFHPKTLREALRVAQIGRLPGNEFIMACFLGILHHQRPGFLSYPSSHLVPYLRDKGYPREEYPEMYEYRELRPRLLAKVGRSFKRITSTNGKKGTFCQSPIESLEFPTKFDALITSPPYMNALDYGRDNRLRLWFIDPASAADVDNDVTKRRQAFATAISSLAAKVETGLRSGGYCVLVVGDALRRTFKARPSEAIFSILKAESPSLHLREILADQIPDIRRSRRDCRGVKTEHFLVFQKD